MARPFLTVGVVHLGAEVRTHKEVGQPGGEVEPAVSLGVLRQGKVVHQVVKPGHTPRGGRPLTAAWDYRTREAWWRPEGGVEAGGRGGGVGGSGGGVGGSGGGVGGSGGGWRSWWRSEAVVEAGGRGGGQRPWWRLEGVVDCSRGSSPCGHHVPEVFSRRPVLQLQHHGLSVTALQASCRDTHTVNGLTRELMEHRIQASIPPHALSPQFRTH